jgi:predicted transcriptional regulator
MNSNEAHPHLTAKIVSEYVGHHRVAAAQLPELITTVHQALEHLGKPTETEATRTPAVSIRQSVRHDYVVCLECGYRGLMLRRHISVRHSLTPDEYRERWGLKINHPLTAPAYSERRSSVAKALGLGRKPANQAVAAEKSEAATAPAEAGRGSRATSQPARRTRRAAPPTEATQPGAVPPRTTRSRRAASEPEQPSRAGDS